MSGSLTIVGTGIALVAHLTPEVRGQIARADKLFYLLMHSLADEWMQELHPRAESLASFYRQKGDRAAIYQAISDHVLASVRTGQQVCAAFYGHPAVFVTPTRLMSQQAQAEGYMVHVFPGISAEDCLFADLQLDPGYQGCQSYEATDFIVRPRHFDNHTPLILWQVGAIGHFEVVDTATNPAPGLRVLGERLLRYYPAKHRVALYEAAVLPTQSPKIAWLCLDDLPHAKTSTISTLYVPPAGEPAIDLHALNQLGIDQDLL
jgi:uncharacterized protein YabN with tetrapyrrole methylase and pyrophosphatase domain